MLLELILLTTVVSLVSLVGGIVFLYNQTLSLLLEKYSIPFAIGTMLATALFGLLPEAIEMIGMQAVLIAGLTMAAVFLIEKYLIPVHHHNHESDCGRGEIHKSVLALIAGDTIHNFVDGVAIGVTYLVNPAAGVVTALSTILHEVPHEIADFGILYRAGWQRAKILLVNVFSAGMAVAGALSVFVLVVDSQVIGLLMAVSAGLFLYLALIDLSAQLHADSVAELVKYVMIALLGFVILAAAFSAVAHDHDGDHPHSLDRHYQEEAHILDEPENGADHEDQAYDQEGEHE